MLAAPGVGALPFDCPAWPQATSAVPAARMEMQVRRIRVLDIVGSLSIVLRSARGDAGPGSQCPHRWSAGGLTAVSGSERAMTTGPSRVVHRPWRSGSHCRCTLGKRFDSVYLARWR